MSRKKYKKGDQLIVTKGQLSGVFGSCVGYGNYGKVKLAIKLEVGDEGYAILSIQRKRVALIPKAV